ncbi:condensation domain-containing protein [Streptomyces sp. ODS05-4]|uniref:condensation domain-containing protein n=1 Tax=Streptomyces sp. ODS05-4 TaxID=2944939 RepID=UPI00210A85B0|nr:condensation domain-containing protein [Streptomyces sp. ODS05-4]
MNASAASTPSAGSGGSNAPALSASSTPSAAPSGSAPSAEQAPSAPSAPVAESTSSAVSLPPPSAAFQEELLRRARARARRGPDAPAAGEHPAEAHRPGQDRAGERVPLSHAQRRMWVLEHLGGAGDSYAVPFGTRIHGTLDPAALGAALTALVRRHTALRLRFGRDEDGEPYQEVLPAPADIAVPVVPCGPAEAAARLAREAQRPFDLAAGALPRALVLRHGERDHTVLVVFHHITVDGGALEIVAAELAALYGAVVDGGAAVLPGDPPQYTDHARRERAAAGGHEAGLRHWAQTLAGAAPVRLPRPDAAPGGGVAVTRSLPAALPRRLRELGTRHRATLFTVALAAAFATLRKLTGADDLVIGVAGTHRRGRAMRELVGLCVNTLPVRVDTGGDPSFAHLLDRVRDALLTAQLHGDVPFDLVLGRLGAAARGADGTALVRVTADVPGEPAVLRLPGTTAVYVDVPASTAKFDLSFGLLVGARPAALVQYAGSALDEETGVALAEAHGAVLAAVAADPGLPLSALPAVARPEADGPAGHPAATVLRAHPRIASAAVAAAPDGAVWAYAVPRGVGGPPPAELRAHLRTRLPAGQVPAAVMLLDALPRTADGALAAAALPGLGAAPAGPRADAVTEGFRTLLGRSPDPDDDFFALGGHSLVAVQLAERLRTALRLPLTGLDVLQARTPRALTALLEGRAAEQAARTGAPVSGRPRGSREGTVLVTGASGGVGAFVVRALAARGRPVRALVRPESAHLLPPVEGVQVVEGDLADLDGLRAAVREADAVVHAACTFTRHEVDLAAMEALAGAWRRGPFVFVSSVDAYGRPPAGTVEEDAGTVEPVSPYGRAKRDAEALLLAVAGRGGRGGASALRAPLVWGRHDRFRDQVRWGATGLLYQAAAGGRDLVVPRPGAAGADWYGAPWVHAAALARAVAAALDTPVDGVAATVSGHVPWRDLAAELLRLTEGGGRVVESDDVDRDLDHVWHYRADRLAHALAPLPGEDWRTALGEAVGG